jgi:probable addiction module antidote protein
MPKRTASFNDWRLSKLSDPDTALHYLNAASSDSPQMFRKAIKNVIQARFHMTHVARKADITREALYKALSDSGNPTDGTMRSVLAVLGYAPGVVKLRSDNPAPPNPIQPRIVGHRAEKQRRARTYRSHMRISPNQLTFKFDNPELGGATQPTPRFAQNFAMPSNMPTLALLSGTRVPASRARLDRLAYEASGAKAMWFLPSGASAGVENSLGTLAEL